MTILIEQALKGFDYSYEISKFINQDYDIRIALYNEQGYKLIKGKFLIKQVTRETLKVRLAEHLVKRDLEQYRKIKLRCTCKGFSQPSDCPKHGVK